MTVLWHNLLGRAGKFQEPSALLRGGHDDGTDENATDAAKQILDLVQRYLSLQPHESANLSIAPCNCNSARLTVASERRNKRARPPCDAVWTAKGTQVIGRIPFSLRGG
jgi:hypothetical protein